jgi:hypothetical protein
VALLRFTGDMPVKRLDETTAQRLITEELTPEDLGGEVARLAPIVEALRRPAHSWELQMERQTVAAMAVAVESPSTNGRVVHLPDPGRSPMSRATRIKVGLLAVAGLLALATGLAVGGHLPEAAQNAFANAADRAGLEGLIPHPEGGGPGVLQEGVGGDVSEVAKTASRETNDTANAVHAVLLQDDTFPGNVPVSVPAGPAAEAGAGNAATVSGGASGGTARSETGTEASGSGAGNADRRGPPSSD